MNLSQSVLKRFLEYKERNFCGLQFKAFYIDKTHRTPTSEAQLAGQYFEYCATGQKNYYGEIPEPPKTKGGKLPALFVRAEEQADHFKDHVKEMKLETVSTGLRAEDFRTLGYRIPKGFDLTVDCLFFYTGEDFKIDDGFGRPTSFLRWLARWKPGNRLFIGDLKYTGALDTNYGDFAYGRDPSGARLTNKTKIKVQPIHYSWLTRLPFAWFVYSSKPDKDAAVFLSNVERSSIQLHATKARKIRSEIESLKKTGFVPYPTISRCRECPLVQDCKFAARSPVPEIVSVYYDEG